MSVYDVRPLPPSSCRYGTVAILISQRTNGHKNATPPGMCLVFTHTFTVFLFAQARTHARTTSSGFGITTVSVHSTAGRPSQSSSSSSPSSLLNQQSLARIIDRRQPHSILFPPARARVCKKNLVQEKNRCQRGASGCMCCVMCLCAPASYLLQGGVGACAAETSRKTPFGLQSGSARHRGGGGRLVESAEVSMYTHVNHSKVLHRVDGHQASLLFSFSAAILMRVCGYTAVRRNDTWQQLTALHYRLRDTTIHIPVRHGS